MLPIDKPIFVKSAFSTLFNNTIKNIQIYDMLGKQVYTKDLLSNERIDVGNLLTGIYVLKVIEEGKTATRKLVIR